MKTLISLLLMLGFLTCQASEKIYINMDELVSQDQSFYIPEGNNTWINSNIIHSEPRGFYIFESDIVRSSFSGGNAYEKHWRCPYCNSYWPEGTPCKNSKCPSRYK